MIETNPEVKAVIGRWIGALGTADWATTSQLFARTAGLRYIGTDFSEWWEGPGVATVFAAHMGEASEFEIHIEPDDVEGYSLGSVG